MMNSVFILFNMNIRNLQMVMTEISFCI